MNYQRKTKPALWTEAFPYQAGDKVKMPDGTLAVVLKSIKGKNSRKLLRTAYNKRVKEWLVGKQCVGCLLSAVHGETDEFPVRRATQCHHKHGRGSRGELLMVERLWVPVCGLCHNWIHANIEAARRLGLYAPRGEWNRLPKVFENKALLSGQNIPK